MDFKLLCVVFVAFAGFSGSVLADGSIGIGTRHACFIDASSKVSCSGRDSIGQLGNGPGNTPSNTPMPVSGSPDARSLAIGYDHTCVLDPVGEVYCWGSDSNGQLGSPLSGDQQLPVKVDTGQLGSVKFVSLSAAGNATCVADDQGRVFCWGKASIADPGAGAQADQPLPKQILLPTNQVTAVALGEGHACALSSAGGLWCWGNNEFGQLGTGQASLQPMIPSAVAVPPGVRFVAVSVGGMHTCALAQTGSAWCWGLGLSGRLGNGTSDIALLPSMVSSPAANTVFKKISAGSFHSCAIDSLGGLWCWGAGLSGNLGVGGPRRDVLVPTAVAFEPDERVDSVTAGADATCAVSVSGHLYCWGDGDAQRLGWGFDAWQPNPIGVTSANDGLTIGAGALHTCAFDVVNSLVCWGANEHGQLGDGSFEDAGGIVAVDKATMPAGVNVLVIDGGAAHTCIMDDQGKAWCWGGNANGQLGIGVFGASIPTPQPVDQSAGQLFKGLSTGANHTCAIDYPGNVWCWGKNGNGELGTGDTVAHSAPVMAVAGGKTFVSIAAGDGFTCAIEELVGAVYCWGNNAHGQLGLNDTVERKSPTQLAYFGFAGFLQISAGDGHVCAGQHVNGDSIKSRLWCWGSNNKGQVGNGTTTDVLQPTLNGFVHGADSLLRPRYMGLGSTHTCVKRSSSLSECWGDNLYGQLADGTSTTRSTPVASQFGFTDQFAAGRYHTCSLGVSGKVTCAGSHAFGQMGNGFVSSPASPTEVPGFTARVDQMLKDGFE